MEYLQCCKGIRWENPNRYSKREETFGCQMETLGSHLETVENISEKETNHNSWVRREQAEKYKILKSAYYSSTTVGFGWNKPKNINYLFSVISSGSLFDLL